MRTDSSEIDVKQRHPLLTFYLAAAGFSVALLLAEHLDSPWHQVLRAAATLLGGFGLWSFFRFVRVADERQMRTGFQAFGFAFTLSLTISLAGGFIQGFSGTHISWLSALELLLIPWSVGLILFSWRYR
jgi:hypothetical protein